MDIEEGEITGDSDTDCHDIKENFKNKMGFKLKTADLIQKCLPLQDIKTHPKKPYKKDKQYKSKDKSNKIENSINAHNSEIDQTDQAVDGFINSIIENNSSNDPSPLNPTLDYNSEITTPKREKKSRWANVDELSNKADHVIETEALKPNRYASKRKFGETNNFEKTDQPYKRTGKPYFNASRQKYFDHDNVSDNLKATWFEKEENENPVEQTSIDKKLKFIKKKPQYNKGGVNGDSYEEDFDKQLRLAQKQAFGIANAEGKDEDLEDERKSVGVSEYSNNESNFSEEKTANPFPVAHPYKPNRPNDLSTNKFTKNFDTPSPKIFKNNNFSPSKNYNANYNNRGKFSGPRGRGGGRGGGRGRGNRGRPDHNNKFDNKRGRGGNFGRRGNFNDRGRGRGAARNNFKGNKNFSNNFNNDDEQVEVNEYAEENEMTGENKKANYQGSGTNNYKSFDKDRKNNRPSYNNHQDFKNKNQNANRPCNNKVKSEYVQQHQPKSICKFYTEGRCTKGDDCKFSHDSSVNSKQEVCKYYIQNTCTKGDACIFMHSEFPCKFFHTGNTCYSGDNCKFSHDVLTQDKTELLNGVLTKNPNETQKESESFPDGQQLNEETDEMIGQNSEVNVKYQAKDQFYTHGFYASETVVDDEDDDDADENNNYQESTFGFLANVMKNQNISKNTGNDQERLTLIAKSKSVVSFQKSVNNSSSLTDTTNSRSGNYDEAELFGAESSEDIMDETLRSSNTSRSSQSPFGRTAKENAKLVISKYNNNNLKPGNIIQDGKDQEEDWDRENSLTKLTIEEHLDEANKESEEKNDESEDEDNEERMSMGLGSMLGFLGTATQENAFIPNEHHVKASKECVEKKEESEDEDNDEEDEREERMGMGLGSILGFLGNATPAAASSTNAYKSIGKKEESEHEDDDVEDEKEERMNMGLGSILGFLGSATPANVSTNADKKDNSNSKETQRQLYFSTDRKFYQDQHEDNYNDKNNWKDKSRDYNNNSRKEQKQYGYNKSNFTTKNNYQSAKNDRGRGRGRFNRNRNERPPSKTGEEDEKTKYSDNKPQRYNKNNQNRPNFTPNNQKQNHFASNDPDNIPKPPYYNPMMLSQQHNMENVPPRLMSINFGLLNNNPFPPNINGVVTNNLYNQPSQFPIPQLQHQLTLQQNLQQNLHHQNLSNINMTNMPNIANLTPHQMPLFRPPYQTLPPTASILPLPSPSGLPAKVAGYNQNIDDDDNHTELLFNKNSNIDLKIEQVPRIRSSSLWFLSLIDGLPDKHRWDQNILQQQAKKRETTSNIDQKPSDPRLDHPGYKFYRKETLKKGFNGNASCNPTPLITGCNPLDPRSLMVSRDPRLSAARRSSVKSGVAQPEPNHNGLHQSGVILIQPFSQIIGVDEITSPTPLHTSSTTFNSTPLPSVLTSTMSDFKIPRRTNRIATTDGEKHKNANSKVKLNLSDYRARLGQPVKNDEKMIETVVEDSPVSSPLAQNIFNIYNDPEDAIL
ncbi:unnamed protein product [Gordionus sp. m RMFG-2023]|uniref:putative uncharacterized protein DDB_G0282133 n=1 Tax=Gordionus sp. m RMFG-2023 TaxID=3053472 RepID=UPI0030E5C6EA